MARSRPIRAGRAQAGRRRGRATGGRPAGLGGCGRSEGGRATASRALRPPAAGQGARGVHAAHDRGAALRRPCGRLCGPAVSGSSLVRPRDEPGQRGQRDREGGVAGLGVRPTPCRRGPGRSRRPARARGRRRRWHRVRELSPRVNRSKTWSARSAGSPGPSSCTSMAAPVAVDSAETVTVVPGGRVVAGVAEQVGDHLVQPLLVAGHDDRLVRQPELPPVLGRRPRGRRRRLRAAARSGRPRPLASGRPESSRASSSRSSTRADIRSASVRPCPGRRRGARPACGGDSSAYPWMVASGVRSSWEASATNWRTCCSLRWRASSAPSTCLEQGVQRGADLADLGAFVGELLGHAHGLADPNRCSARACVTSWATSATSRRGRSWRRTSSRPPAEARAGRRPG